MCHLGELLVHKCFQMTFQMDYVVEVTSYSQSIKDNLSTSNHIPENISQKAYTM